MKKILKLVFIIVFVVVCVIPVFTMPFFAEEESAEKRELSEKPVLYSQEDGFNMNYTSQLNTYLTEHFSFRSDLVTLWSVIQAKVFSSSTQENVIVGKDDWLYFADTLNDYTGKSVFTQKEVSSIVKTLDLINETVEKNGGKLVFSVAPNKNTVYPEYMPYYYIEADTPTNYELLGSALKDKSYYLDVLPALQQSEEITYHKRDSHWNNLGAQIYFTAVMNHLGIECTDYSKITTSKEYSWRGDLDDMIFPKLNYLDEQIIYNKSFDFDYTSSFHSNDDINIKTFNQNGTGNLMMYRDSFTNALLPFFSDQFQKAEYTRVQPFRFNTLTLKKSDTFIIEMAERNLPELLKSAPIMEAPKRADSQGMTVSDLSFTSREYLNYTHIYGETGDEISDIFIKVTQNNEVQYFEAFPIYEKELIEGESVASEIKKYGFSAYLPADISQNAEIKILTNGELK